MSSPPHTELLCVTTSMWKAHLWEIDCICLTRKTSFFLKVLGQPSKNKQATLVPLSQPASLSPRLVRGRKWTQCNLKLAGSRSIFDWHQSLVCGAQIIQQVSQRKPLRVSEKGFLTPPVSGWYAEPVCLDRTAYLWDLSCPFKPEEISCEMECQMTQRQLGRLRQRQTDKEN